MRNTKPAASLLDMLALGATYGLHFEYQLNYDNFIDSAILIFWPLLNSF